MKTLLTARNLADLTQALLCNPESIGELDSVDKHSRFLTDLARLITEHCGGSVPNDAYVCEHGCVVVVEENDSLPESGGVWRAMQGEAARGLPFKDLSISMVSTGSAWAPQYNGVLVKHIPTGVSAKATDSNSQHRNRDTALQELQKNPLVIAYGKTEANLVSALYPLEIVSVLSRARVYVDGAYECAFPDEGVNQQVLADIDELIKRLKG